MQLPNDISRCNNHRCRLRNNCKRYLQIAYDFHKDRNNKIPVTRFSGTKQDEFESVIECDEQLKLNTDE